MHFKSTSNGISARPGKKSQVWRGHKCTRIENIGLADLPDLYIFRAFATTPHRLLGYTTALKRAVEMYLNSKTVL